MDTSGLIVITICFTLLTWAILTDVLRTIEREASFISSVVIVLGSLMFWYNIAKYMLGVK